MFNLLVGLVAILTLFLYLRNRLSAHRVLAALVGLFILAALSAMLVIHSTLHEEYMRAKEKTFYDADLQMTIGIYCIANRVMYKEKDSIRRADYPLQDLNENTYSGTLSTRMSCDNGVFRDENGKAIDRNQILKIVTENVLTGYLPYTASTDALVILPKAQ